MSKTKKPQAEKEENTNTDNKQIKVKPLQIGFLTIAIKGQTPLILHKFSDTDKNKMLDKQTTTKQKDRKPRDIKKEIEESIYKTRNGKIGIPARQFKASFLKSVKHIEGLKSDHIKSLFVLGDILPLKFKKRDVVECMVKIGRFRETPYVRYLPAFYEWQTDLIIKYDTSVLTPEIILNIVRIAGFHSGVGDFRPSLKGGSYGQYDIGDKHFSKKGVV